MVEHLTLVAAIGKMAVTNVLQNGMSHRATVVGAMKNMTFNPFYGSQLEPVVPNSATKGEKFQFQTGWWMGGCVHGRIITGALNTYKTNNNREVLH